MLTTLVTAWAAGLAVRLLTAEFRQRLSRHEIPEMIGILRLWAGMMRHIPDILHLTVFLRAALLILMDEGELNMTTAKDR